jgi:hypothetical protein
LFIPHSCANIAQLVERLTCNQEVESSSLSISFLLLKKGSSFSLSFSSSFAQKKRKIKEEKKLMHPDKEN